MRRRQAFSTTPRSAQDHTPPVERLLVQPDRRPGWFVARLEGNEQAGGRPAIFPRSGELISGRGRPRIGTQICVPNAENRPGSLETQICVSNAAGIIARSRQPMADAARVLLARGFDPATPLTMRHAGKAHDSFVPLPIAAWAGWTYKERDKRGLSVERWIPIAVPRSGQGTIPAGPAAVRAAGTEFAPAAPPGTGTAGRPAGAP